jgi:mRNA interferase RelE/StbE
MKYNLTYHPTVKKVDLPKIDTKNKSMIKRAIEERLTTQPEIYGSPLKSTLKGYWKLRVGNYRIVFKISGNNIKVFAIIDRKTVYHQSERRIDDQL